jgi:quinol monooxygenase YgiN
MATMIVKHQVADFARWKKVFDEMKAERLKHGWIGHDVLRSANNPNEVVIINRMKSIDQAKAYGQSPALREAMQRGGVTGAPEITLLNDEEAVSY